MPGRQFGQGENFPGVLVNGTTTVNGYTIPIDLNITGRVTGDAAEYVASSSVEFGGEFESSVADEFSAYIADGTYEGTGNQVTGGGTYGTAGRYRYGFNGQEMSNEIKGVGNSYTAEFWEYDPRVGKRWNLDPRPVTGLSEYSAFAGNPIFNSDPFGDTTGVGLHIPLMNRLPSNGSVAAGVGNFLYNAFTNVTNATASAWNTTVDYTSELNRNGLPGVINKIDNTYRSISDVVGNQYSYFENTPAAQIKADAKGYFTNVDNYFQAAEQAAVIGGAWKFSLSFNQTTLRTSTAAEFEEVTYNNGWRTPDGKFASPRGDAPLSGSVGENSVWNAIEQKPGWTVQRGRVAVRNVANELRIFDGVATGPSNRTIGLEIKSGTARRSKFQRAFDSGLNSGRTNTAKGVGASSGITIHRTLQIRVD